MLIINNTGNMHAANKICAYKPVNDMKNQQSDAG